jgi:hypothetical protein
MNRAMRRAVKKNGKVHSNRMLAKDRAVHLATSESFTEILRDELVAVSAMAGGWAQASHYEMLLETMILLENGGERRQNKQAINTAEAAYVALANMRDRYDETGKFGCTGDELAMLRLLVSESQDFWLRQGVKTYLAAHAELAEMKALMYAERTESREAA